MRRETPGLFIGIEREGMLSGMSTLFVQGTSSSWEDILQAARERNINHLEFGAGRQMFWDNGALRRSLDSNQFTHVTVETSSLTLIPQDLLRHPKLHFFVTLLMPESHSLMDMLSIRDELLIQEYAANPRVQIKVATGVQIAVFNCEGLKSFNRNDIFQQDVALD